MSDSDQSKTLVIEEVIEKLRYFANLYGIESLFVVGGYCRDTLLNRQNQIEDIDVASAYHEQAIQLGGLFASEVLNTAPEFYKRSGAAAVKYTSEFGSIKIEFQGQSTNAYMYNQDVRTWMHNQGIEDVPLMNNIYGRDFTINTVIYSLKKDAFYDITQLATEDFEKKLIKTILPANMIVQYNPLIILRAIRFALTYDFHIDYNLRDAITGQVDLLKTQLSEDRIMKEIVRILKFNGPKGLELLKHYELDSLLLRPDIKEHLNLESRNE